MHQTGRSQKRTNKWFAGSPFGNPKKIAGFRNSVLFFGNAKGNPKKVTAFRNSTIFFRTSKRNSTIFFRPPHKNFVKFGNKLVTKRVAKDIDPTRVKRIKPTNKYKIRLFLEKNNYFHRKVIRVSSASSKRLS